jgi:hypothetical protein
MVEIILIAKDRNYPYKELPYKVYVKRPEMLLLSKTGKFNKNDTSVILKSINIICIAERTQPPRW